MHRQDPTADADSAAETTPHEDVKKPWRVLLHNDDFTPVEYVVKILEDVFGLGAFKATWVMMKAHMSGMALVGVYPVEEAAQRVAAAHRRARADSWPLHFSYEPED